MFLTITKALAVAGALVLTTASNGVASPLAHRDVQVGDQTFHLRLAAPRLLGAGFPVPVAGNGYNPAQGIFVALCVIPSSVVPGDPTTYTSRPGPCLGTKGEGGTSHRVTNDATGEHTSAYGPRGSFRAVLTLQPKISDSAECDVNVRCAIVTRADFTATANRNYDLYVPVEFVR